MSVCHINGPCGEELFAYLRVQFAVANRFNSVGRHIALHCIKFICENVPSRRTLSVLTFFFFSSFSYLLLIFSSFLFLQILYVYRCRLACLTMTKFRVLRLSCLNFFIVKRKMHTCNACFRRVLCLRLHLGYRAMYAWKE